jgi:hypothetical protein
MMMTGKAACFGVELQAISETIPHVLLAAQ